MLSVPGDGGRTDSAPGDRRRSALGDDVTGMAAPIEPTTTYLQLAGGLAEVLQVDDEFWLSVMSGERPLNGWLVTGSAQTPGAGGGHSEVHLKGDEVHLCQTGAMEAVFEHADGEEVIAFGPGEVCVISAGVWHRLRTVEPSRVLSLTFGRGTEHRPSPA